MIPKIVHYCWFGGKPLDRKSKKCIESWKKYFPDYEIKEWNEQNFDFNSCQYAREAYQSKKWAFVSDYARFKILYEYGGIYFDTDVEVIKDFSPILEGGAFMGCERKATDSCMAVAPGLGLGVNPGLGLYKEIIDDYEQCSFYKNDGSINLYTVVERTTDILKKYGLKSKDSIQEIAGVSIYPKEYFCPIDVITGELEITENTYSIHHFAGTWLDKKIKRHSDIYRFINKNFGKRTADYVRKVFGNCK